MNCTNGGNVIDPVTNEHFQSCVIFSLIKKDTYSQINKYNFSKIHLAADVIFLIKCRDSIRNQVCHVRHQIEMI